MNKSLSVLKDEDGLLQEDLYSFEVKNTGSGNAKYNLKLIDDRPSDYSGTIIDDKYIKIGLEVNGEEVGPYTLSEVNSIIDKGIIEVKETVPYKLRIWLDSSKESELEALEDAKVYLKLELEVEQSLSENPNLDTSGANSPVLSDGMIPVYYDSNNSVWRKADVNNKAKAYRWYDYSSKIWANAVTVTETNRSTYLKADAGVEIPISDINTMWVWIPRYTYTYFSTNTPKEIKISFESGTSSSGTISCKSNIVGTSSTSETCTDSVNSGLVAGTSTYTHPAFWFDSNNDDVRTSNEELKGIWVGKFELTGTIGDITIKPNLSSLRGQTISSFETNIMNMKNTNNKYGFSTSSDSHMIKNMEWGAVAYLAHSKYGRCESGTCSEISINNCSNYITGIGADGVSSSSGTYSCTNNDNKYNGSKGVLASTTGNVYGIYDMSGGAWEYMMGDLVSSTGVMMSGDQTSNNYHSGFTGYLYSGGQTTLTYDFPNKRYYDKYSYGTTETGYTRGKLGDATKEMGPSSYWSWYSTYASFPHSGYTWFSRGSYYNNGSSSILFAFYYKYGEADLNYSSRAVISNLS